MTLADGIDSLAGERIWSESVYADCVSPDGRSGMMLRLCRYPNQQTSWLWAFLFLPDRILGYNDHYLPCPDLISPVEEPDTAYVHVGEAEEAVFQRLGHRDGPSGARAFIRLKAHALGKDAAPHGLGDRPLRIEARLDPGHAPWRPNRYRSEWVGPVRATAWVDGLPVELSGLGHWHEQHQKAPRWRTPFVYISLRGPELSFVGTAMPDEAAAFVVRSGQTTRVASIRIDPPAQTRQVEVTLEDGDRLAGTITTTHDYLLPINDKLRPGTLATARLSGHDLSGCVNDWTPGV